MLLQNSSPDYYRVSARAATNESADWSEPLCRPMWSIRLSLSTDLIPSVHFQLLKRNSKGQRLPVSSSDREVNHINCNL